MSLVFARPIRNRIKLTPDENLTAFKNAVGQYRLGCVMVVLNLVFPFSGEAFGYYLLPTIVMFALACVISLTRRMLWPRNAGQDEMFAAGLVAACVVLWVSRGEFVFTQRLLGSWEVPNVFAKFTLFHVAGLAVAASLIPRDDCWSPLRVAALLAGTCIVGAGMPGKEIVRHEHYVLYLGLVSIAFLILVNGDVAQCFRAWCASSPLTNLEGSNRILVLSSTEYCVLSPLAFLLDIPGFAAAVWRAQVLWLSAWPVPPESLDPKLLELSHFPPLRQAGVRRLAAAVSQASIFAFALVAYPPASFANPYLAFAAELLAPPLVQLVALSLIHGPFLLEAEELSLQFQKGNP